MGASDSKAAPPALTFLHASPSWGEGGREIRAVQLMGMLGTRVRHVLVAHDSRFAALDQIAPDVDAVRVERRFDGGAVARLRAMVAFLREMRPDLLLTYNWGAVEWLLAARLVRLGAVVHHEDGFGPEETGRRLWRRNLARRVLLRFARAVVVPSHTLETIARREWGVRDRLRWLPNGVDVTRFRPGPADGATTTTFLCVGALRPEKNQILAVEALARASCRERARLLLVGDGPDRAGIVARATALGVQDRVELTGAVADTAPCYRRAHVFVIPSHTEQMPLSLLEAMASGLPVVGTDVGDVERIVTDENHRWIVPPGDAARLARAMDEAAMDPAARTAIGAHNRDKVLREFSKDECYGAYCRLYLDLAGAR